MNSDALFARTQATEILGCLWHHIFAQLDNHAANYLMEFKLIQWHWSQLHEQLTVLVGHLNIQEHNGIARFGRTINLAHVCRLAFSAEKKDSARCFHCQNLGRSYCCYCFVCIFYWRFAYFPLDVSCVLACVFPWMRSLRRDLKLSENVTVTSVGSRATKGMREFSSEKKENVHVMCVIPVYLGFHFVLSFLCFCPTVRKIAQLIFRIFLELSIQMKLLWLNREIHISGAAINNSQ